MKHIKCNQRLLFVLCVAALSLPNFILFFTEPTPLIARVCNVVLPVSIWWMVMTLVKRPGKMFYIVFLFVFFDAFQIVLLDMYGEAILAVDMFLNLMTTNVYEAGEQLGGILPAVIFVVVIYVPIMFWSVVSFYHPPLTRRFIYRHRKYATCGLIRGALMLVSCYFTVQKFSFINDIYPINVVDNLDIAIRRTVRTNMYGNTSKHFRFDATPTHSASERETYILVIGETARADNFGVYGYERNTTPRLAANERLCVYRDALTQANVTHKSVPMILTSVSAENFDSIYVQKSIITAFNEAGFRTAFFSNQRPNRSFIDFFGEEAQNCVFVKAQMKADANVSDDVLLGHLRSELADTTVLKRFVVLHTYGSHFNYCDRYPESDRHFTPDRITTIGYRNRDVMVNAYDNSILYTDRLLSNVIELADSVGGSACVIYLSDHGEDIYDDDRRRYMHASPVPSYYQLRVPFMLWTSTEYGEAHPVEDKAVRQNVNCPIATNQVVFHTLLGLSGIHTTYRDDRLSVGSPHFSAPKRYYLNDHNEPQSLDAIGLKRQDLEMFQKNGLRYP